MTNTTDTANALAAALPTTSTLTAVRSKAHARGDNVTRAVTATFVGSPSADLAVVLFDESAVNTAISGDQTQTLTAADVLLPALTAAAESLGNGALGEAEVADATALFNDRNSDVFQLTEADGTVVGVFVVRVRAVTSTTKTEFVAAKLGRINSVEMALTVEIGRTRMSIRDVLGLEPGAVVELDRSAGAPADILLNGRLIAHGEVVVVDQDYAVRITKILDVVDGTI